MFTSEERERLRDGLVSAAKADPRIIGAALAGSNAHGREDRWSDIDLALSLDADADHTEVVADWTDRMYASSAGAGCTRCTPGRASLAAE